MSQFKQLKAEWYKRLNKSGFEDQEDQYERLKCYSQVKAPEEAKVEYYRLAGQFLYEYEFALPLHRSIWALHAGGFGRNAICSRLRVMSKVKTTPAKVRRILEKLGREFKVYRYISDSYSETD